MHEWSDWGFGFGHWGFGILFWIILIALVVFLVMGVAGSWRGAGGRSERSALDILEERYARGEIDKDEFERKRRDIQG